VWSGRLGVAAVRGFWVGASAGFLFVMVELAGRVIAGVPTLPELVQDRLVLFLPGPVFAFVLDRLLYLGKPSFFVGLILLQLVAAGLVGSLAARLRLPLLLGMVFWLLTGLVLLPAAGKGVFGSSSAVALVSLLAYGLYAVGLQIGLGIPFVSPRTVAVANRPAPPSATGQSLPTRRVLVGTTLSAVVSLFLGRSVIGTLPSLPPTTSGALASGGPPGSATPSASAGLPPDVTPPDQFYLVSKNLVDPVVDTNSWRLAIDGMVTNSLNLSFADILALPSEQVYRTLECISNEVGGDLISNGLWTGIRLGDLLRKAVVAPRAALVHFSCADGYTESMDLTKALDPSTLLVYKLDGQLLPTKHGSPLRVLGTGTFGMKNPKWITRITAALSAAPGFWEAQGWTPDALVQTMSRIDSPSDGGSVPLAPVTVAGIAFAGDRGIQKVEVSVDGGKSWQTADLEKSLGPSTWTLWTYRWQPPKAGQYQLVVRATDGTGKIQSARQTDTFPVGATGYHSISVQVSA